MQPEPIPAQRKTETREVAVLALDIRRFSAYTDTERTRIATDFRNDIEAAFLGSDLQEAWSEREFCQNTGDGIVAGFPKAYLRAIVDGLPQALQLLLRERHHRGEGRIRMRLGIAVGTVQGIADERVDVAPNQVIIDACRIADSKACKMLLENSDENATFLAVAVTPAVISGTIGPDPAWLRATEFVNVSVDMQDKDYHAEAFLHVPSPSGYLLRYGLSNLPLSAASEDASIEPLEDAVGRGETELRLRTSGQASTVGSAGHDLHDESTRAGDIGRDAIGVGSGNRVQVDRSTHDDHSRKVHRGNVFHGEVSAGEGGTVNAFGGDQHNYEERPAPRQRKERE
ncbi:hypothetical protein [Glycomyces sp. NPDC048151]|uniref:hypothetical protein n=1 Tax=Glycomyces sp. NPDC048151 TaxID=3364002 RepID=UPI00371E7A59